MTARIPLLQTPCSVTGQSITSTLGDSIVSVGTLIIPTNFEITSTQGTTVVPNEDVTLGGLEAEFTLGLIVGTGSVAVPLTGVSFSSSVGTIDPVDQVMGLSGVSFSSSVGIIDPADQVVGLTGLSITFTLGAPFIIHYQDVDTGSNTNYSNVSTGSNTNYSSVATGSNTSYNDVAA